MPTSIARLHIRLFAALALLLAPALPAGAVEIERVESPGGIVAWLVQDHANPIIALELTFKGGSALDPTGKLGLAEMAVSLLDEGAGKYDSQAFQKRLEDLSVGLSFGAGFDTLSGSLKTLTENRDAAFDMLRLALTKARFDADPVERIRSQTLVILARNAKNPNRIASRRWWSRAFPGHPYGRPRNGTETTVKAITRTDLKAFARARLARSNLIVAVVGDITPKVLGPLLDRTFGGLPLRPVLASIANAKPRLTGKITVVRRPMPQSRVIFGQAGVARDDKDWYAAYVMNYILGGGGFTSRLMTEVREKRGLAYSVASWLAPLDHAALLNGSVGTANSRVAETIRIIRAEWARMRDEGASEKELADAKTYLTGSFPLRLDSTDSIAGLLVAMQRRKLGIDYIDKRSGYINAVTMADIKRVAKKLLTPDRLTFVVVGQPEKLDGAASKPETKDDG